MVNCSLIFNMPYDIIVIEKYLEAIEKCIRMRDFLKVHFQTKQIKWIFVVTKPRYLRSDSCVA